MEHESVLQDSYWRLRGKLVLAEKSNDESFQYQAVVFRAFIEENSLAIELKSRICTQICEDLNWEQNGRPGILNRASIALEKSLVDAKQPQQSAQTDEPLPATAAAHKKRFNSIRDR